jgi:protein-arginine kinase activator protein McsA
MISQFNVKVLFKFSPCNTVTRIPYIRICEDCSTTFVSMSRYEDSSLEYTLVKSSINTIYKNVKHTILKHVIGFLYKEYNLNVGLIHLMKVKF